MQRLPIYQILPELKEALHSDNRAILQAAPGAGKTTVVPLSLLEDSWLEGRKIVMLEPRRLAARAAAERMAGSLGERIGGRVGYRMRGETKVSANTRIEVVTEGVLTRMLQSDPELEGVGLVIFDEFHERSIHADLGLALALQVQELFRGDLRILLMSATLQAESLRRVLGEVPLVESEGRSYPVELRYLDPRTPRPLPGEIAELTAGQVLQALKREEGSLLVFLPGVAEIRKTERLLHERVGEEVLLAPLYGAMDAGAQRRAIETAPKGKRKVVLATNIAETSLTIEGVRVVIDSGLERRVRFDAASGMDRYETRLISRESATQRAGRAGRTEPGVCVRLWHEGRALPPTRPPEIFVSDLSPLRLELAAWGAVPGELTWINPPPAHAVESAERLLRKLGMVDVAGCITPHGEKALLLGQPPRIAHMLLEAKRLNLGDEGALLALYWQERPFKAWNADLREILEETAKRCSRDPRLGRALERLLKKIGVSGKETIEREAAGLLTALAYPERIALSRGERNRYLCVSGKGAVSRDEALAGSRLLAVAGLGGQGAEGIIYEAAPLEEALLQEHFSSLIEEREEVKWNPEREQVEARVVERLGAITLRSRPLEDPDEVLIVRALLEALRSGGLESLPWEKESRRLLERLRFAHHHRPGSFPDIREETLLKELENWLTPYLAGMRSMKDLQKLKMKEILQGAIGWETLRKLEEFVPERITVPSGSRVVVDYSDPERAVLAVRLQELFGWRETPRILEGRLPLTIHLLSPARRPLQITEDLSHFWAEVYSEVRKEMRGRYPKHYWPEDPFAAVATTKTKKGMGL